MADRIVAVSEAVDEWLTEILSPRVQGRIRVVRNGIDLKRFAVGDRDGCRARLRLPCGAPVIGMVANLATWKRHDAFIAAAAFIRDALPDARFVIVGRDLFLEHAVWWAQLERQVEQAGLSESLQWVRECDDIMEVLPAFDLLLHPAMGEPFGRVICEAMAAGVPVIAAESGGPVHIIKNGVSGMLVRGGAPQAMADTAVTLLRDRETVARLSAAGKELVAAKFSADRVCDQLASVYKDLLFSIANSHDDDD